MIWLILAVKLVNPPETISQPEIDYLWEKVAVLTKTKKEESPVIFFCDETEVDALPFIALYYPRTNMILTSPRLFNPSELHQKIKGWIYVMLGHEMMHYALYDEIPLKDHHELFNNNNWNMEIVNHLISRDAAHPYLRTEQERFGQ